MTNVELFLFSGKHPEPMFDPYYNKKTSLIIPRTSAESNALVAGNERMIELISAFDVLRGLSVKPSDPHMAEIVREIVDILDNTNGINLSAFAQFFMVYSSSHDTYKKYRYEDRLTFVREMLTRFCTERHSVYVSHGYSNMTLQVVADNYSHKRNSKTSIVKVEECLSAAGFLKVENIVSARGHAYLLPDKGGKKGFRNFKDHFAIDFLFARTEQDKLPDMVIKINDDYYVAELKNMKGSGGGQDKQITEVVNFIRYAETNTAIHYLTFLDGDYFNILTTSNQPKIRRQYEDILECLHRHPGNYFLNTAGFVQFLEEHVRSRI